MFGEMTLRTIHVVSCASCGYSKSLSGDELANWDKGERFFGSKRCPSCSCSGESLASYASKKPKESERE